MAVLTVSGMYSRLCFHTIDAALQDSLWHAHVISTTPWTPTVLHVELEVTHQVEEQTENTTPAAPAAATSDEFGFHSGQWVDFCVPGIERVGGFSISSTPAELPRMELLVRQSIAQPAAWVHSGACRPGSAVVVRAGGSFWHDVGADPFRETRNIVLIGGGIGMSPLLGIMREWTRWRASRPEAAGLGRPGGATMTVIQTANGADELVWADQTAKLQRSLGGDVLGVHFATTETATDGAGAGVNGSASAAASGPTRTPYSLVGLQTRMFDSGCLHRHRVDLGLLEAAAARAGDLVSDVDAELPTGHAKLVQATNAPLWFVCGPPEMIDDVSRLLVKGVGVHPSRVRFERWW